MSEGDALHKHNNLGIAEDSQHRLRYPDHINYYHYDPQSFITENPQQAGMIVSHFLTALAQGMVDTCGVETMRSRELVFYLLQETLNELGDLTSLGRNSATVETINMSTQLSDTWVSAYTPPNLRVFAQKLAKHFRRIIDGQSTCNDVIFGAKQIGGAVG